MFFKSVTVAMSKKNSKKNHQKMRNTAMAREEEEAAKKAARAAKRAAQVAEAAGEMAVDDAPGKTSASKAAKKKVSLVKALGAKGATLKVRNAEVTAVAEDAVPRAKHELSLYAHISKISWHYEATDRIKGRINAHEGKDLRVIDFAERDRSEYELANELWNMID